MSNERYEDLENSYNVLEKKHRDLLVEVSCDAVIKTHYVTKNKALFLPFEFIKKSLKTQIKMSSNLLKWNCNVIFFCLYSTKLNYLSAFISNWNSNCPVVIGFFRFAGII